MLVGDQRERDQWALKWLQKFSWGSKERCWDSTCLKCSVSEGRTSLTYFPPLFLGDQAYPPRALAKRSLASHPVTQVINEHPLTWKFQEIKYKYLHMKSVNIWLFLVQKSIALSYKLVIIVTWLSLRGKQLLLKWATVVWSLGKLHL